MSNSEQGFKLSWLPRLLSMSGRTFDLPELLELKRHVFKIGAQLTKNCNEDGNWDLQTIDGCTFLVAPEGTYSINTESKLYAQEVNAKTFGAILTLLIYNHYLNEVIESEGYAGFLVDHYYSMLLAVSYGRGRIVPAHALKALEYAERYLGNVTKR